jgi:hypothetical protein
MADFIDRIVFKDLSEQDPKKVCARTGCVYDTQAGCYKVMVWGETYWITPSKNSVMREGANGTRNHDHGFLSLFTMHYLLETRSPPLDQVWISEKEIPGGATFFRGPHALPTELITKRFGNDLTLFRARCEAIGGTPLEMADAAYRFEIVPQVPVAVLYWCGDEEFPAEARLLFDKNISRYLATDVVFSLAVGVCERLGR